jgi:hypothetical protein
MFSQVAQTMSGRRSHVLNGFNAYHVRLIGDLTESRLGEDRWHSRGIEAIEDIEELVFVCC